jgi:alpha-galactosidase
VKPIRWLVPVVGPLSVAFALCAAIAAPVSAAQLAQKDDIVVHATETGWIVANSQLTYGLVFDATGTLVVQDLRKTGERQSWRPSPVRDTLFRIGDRELALTRNDSAGFRHTGVDVVDTGAALELRLTFEDSRDGLRARRVYALYPQLPILETWTELESLANRSTTVSDLVTLQLVIDGALATTVDGLNAPDETGGAFAVHHRAIGLDESIVMEEFGRSTARYLPIASITSARGTLVAGLIWSGSWRMDLVGRDGARTELTAWMSDTVTTVAPGRPVLMPHAILGVVPDETRVAPALHRFIVNAVRGGRALEPLVTFNTWFAMGAGVDQESIEAAMQAAAAAGTELFELDAGWYERAGELGTWDFASGLGTFRVDKDKFPDGLRPLAEIAHGLGMKFGVWVEPERVDLRYLGEPGMAREEWLQLENGLYEPGVPNEEARTGMLDLGNPDARAWLLDKLSVLVIESGADHLKWDNNAWMTNTRQGPGAGPHDGNYRHISGLYEVLAGLKDRFPWLLIENCSGGGNRLDLGLMRYTDAGWMDDRTSPSAHVRHNLQGLTTFLPPAYLLSYLLHDANEPMHEAADLGLLANSRMPGVFGLSFPTGMLDENDIARVREQVERWKALRTLQSTASATLVSPQVNGTNSGPWDGTLLVSPDYNQAVLFAFQNDPDVTGATMRMRGLDRRFEYHVTSDQAGEIGVMTGASLMDDGLEIFAAEDTRAQLITMTKVTAEDAARLRAARSQITAR